jgi:hypothetical protein
VPEDVEPPGRHGLGRGDQGGGCAGGEDDGKPEPQVGVGARQGFGGVEDEMRGHAP